MLDQRIDKRQQQIEDLDFLIQKAEKDKKFFEGKGRTTAVTQNIERLDREIAKHKQEKSILEGKNRNYRW